MQGSAGGKGRKTRKRDGELLGEALWAFFPLSDLPRDSWGTHTAGPGKADPHLKEVRLGEGENPEKRLFQAEQRQRIQSSGSQFSVLSTALCHSL